MRLHTPNSLISRYRPTQDNAQTPTTLQLDGHIMTPMQALRYYESESLTKDAYIIQLGEEKQRYLQTIDTLTEVIRRQQLEIDSLKSTVTKHDKSQDNYLIAHQRLETTRQELLQLHNHNIALLSNLDLSSNKDNPTDNSLSPTSNSPTIDRPLKWAGSYHTYVSPKDNNYCIPVNSILDTDKYHTLLNITLCPSPITPTVSMVTTTPPNPDIPTITTRWRELLRNRSKSTPTPDNHTNPT